MLNHNQKESKMNDIIFARRNKSYGAYAIRINYNSVVIKSLMIASTLVLSGLLLASKFSRYDRPLPEERKNTGFIIDSLIYQPVDLEQKNKKEEQKAEEEKAEEPKKSVNTDNQVAAKIKDDKIDRDIKQDSLPVVVKKEDDKLPSGDPSDPNLGIPGSGKSGVSTGGNTGGNGNTNEPFLHTENMPEFPGDNLLSYLTKNTIYPMLAKERNIEQDFSVRFIIDESGKVIKPEVLNPNIDPSLETEALRVINSMPKWKPGKNNGKEVKVYCVVPFRFRLKK